MKCKLSWQIVIIFSCLLFNCNTHKQDYKVLHQVTGPIETNCYLLYDVKSKEAALIDVGGTIDSLIDYIEDNNLRLKYIFATHCHMDHIGGLPEIREKFPDAQLCLNEADYDDCFKFPQWLEENMDSAEVAYMKNDPEMGKWFTYKRSMFGEPDILLDDNQVYKLGKLAIKTYLSPGHSRGSICFYAGDVLFSGDLLFYRQVGRTDLLGGSNEAIINSVRRLYNELPDETIVYPGHGKFTDIGSEKLENEEITIDTVKFHL